VNPLDLLFVCATTSVYMIRDNFTGA